MNITTVSLILGDEPLNIRTHVHRNSEGTQPLAAVRLGDGLTVQTCVNAQALRDIATAFEVAAHLFDEEQARIVSEQTAA